MLAVKTITQLGYPGCDLREIFSPESGYAEKEKYLVKCYALFAPVIKDEIQLLVYTSKENLPVYGGCQ